MRTYNLRCLPNGKLAVKVSGGILDAHLMPSKFRSGGRHFDDVVGEILGFVAVMGNVDCRVLHFGLMFFELFGPSTQKNG